MNVVLSEVLPACTDTAKVLEDALHAGKMPSESIFGQFEGELGIVIESIARGFAIDQAG